MAEHLGRSTRTIGYFNDKIRMCCDARTIGLNNKHLGVTRETRHLAFSTRI
jgi:hypothetical protein